MDDSKNNVSAVRESEKDLENVLGELEKSMNELTEEVKNGGSPPLNLQDDEIFSA